MSNLQDITGLKLENDSLIMLDKKSKPNLNDLTSAFRIGIPGAIIGDLLLGHGYRLQS